MRRFNEKLYWENVNLSEIYAQASERGLNERQFDSPIQSALRSKTDEFATQEQKKLKSEMMNYW